MCGNRKTAKMKRGRGGRTQNGEKIAVKAIFILEIHTVRKTKRKVHIVRKRDKDKGQKGWKTTDEGQEIIKKHCKKGRKWY